MPEDVAALLAELKLTEFGPALVNDGVKSVAGILKLKEDDLAEIGMPKVARRELLEAAAAAQARLDAAPLCIRILSVRCPLCVRSVSVRYPICDRSSVSARRVRSISASCWRLLPLRGEHAK